MNPETPGLDLLFGKWADQLGRSLEVVTGKRPATDFRQNESKPSFPANALWWKQTFAGDFRFSILVGAAESTWMVLGKTESDAGSDARRAKYLELMGEAMQRTATSIPTPMGKIRCEEGEFSTMPDLEEYACATVSLTWDEDAKVELLVLIERDLEDLLAARLERPATEAAQSTSRLSESPMLERLRNVNLPVTIVLGSAELSIGEVFQMRRGTFVDLNRQMNDLVELRIHDATVAFGELVTVKGNYAIRIKRIVERNDRLALLAS